MDLLAKFGAWAAPLALLPLCLNCISMHSGMISTAVRGLTSSALQTAGVTNAKVIVDGRDVVLTGRVDTEEQKAKAAFVAFAAPGVRTVDNQLIVGLDAKTLQPTLTKLLLEKKIEFETGKNVLLPQSIPVLEEVLKALNQGPTLAIRVAGHTDNVGTPENNRTLSATRAQAVVDWLASRGIAKERMTALGHGPDQPLATNNTPDGRAKNRRVEIVVN